MVVDSSKRVSVPACLAIGGGSLLSVALMAHHPTTHGEGIAATVAEIVDEAHVNAVVHGGLIVLMGLMLAGFVDFARLLGWEHLRVRVGMVAYAAGMLWLTGAALVSGFVTTGIARAYAVEPESELEGLRTIFHLTWETNQALARAGTVGWALAVFLWSLVLRGRTGAGARTLAGFGLLLGAAPVLGVVSGHLQLHLHGMLAVVLGLSLWSTGAAAWMFRQRGGAVAS